jgi:uroporphyrin-III C-methyltransferase/precorrin-2 dehydrogenase/sirohydrochlorin ferrochelatase
MGKSIAAATASKLIERGMNPSLPIGIVVNAGRRDRSLYRGSLGDLAEGDLAMEDGPAIILVGEAVAHGDWAEAAQVAERRYKVA